MYQLHIVKAIAFRTFVYISRKKNTLATLLGALVMSLPWFLSTGSMSPERDDNVSVLSLLTTSKSTGHVPGITRCPPWSDRVYIDP